MDFTFYTPTRVIFGAGCLAQLPQWITGTNVLLVTDKTMTALGWTSKVVDLLKDYHVEVFDSVDPNPTDISVDAAAEMANAMHAHTVIGLGGGSPMDVAKGAAVLCCNDGSLCDYRRGGTRTFSNPGLPIIAIPSTAGTGSEVTFAGVYSFTSLGTKGGIITPFFYPQLALVDPTLTYSVPPRGTAATGLDALTHAMESYMGEKDTPQSEGMALIAVKNILESLPLCLENPENHAARDKMAMASLVASHASSQSEIALGHAAGYPVTQLYHLEHGFACAMFLPETIRLANLHRPERMDEMARYCGLANGKDLGREVDHLLKICQCPTSLRSLGGMDSHIDKIVDDAMNARYITNTPGGMTREQLTEIVTQMM